MAANDQLWTWGQQGHRGLWMSTSKEQQLSDLSETCTEMEKDHWVVLLKFMWELQEPLRGVLDIFHVFIQAYDSWSCIFALSWTWSLSQPLS